MKPNAESTPRVGKTKKNLIASDPFGNESFDAFDSFGGENTTRQRKDSDTRMRNRKDSDTRKISLSTNPLAAEFKPAERVRKPPPPEANISGLFSTNKINSSKSNKNLNHLIQLHPCLFFVILTEPRKKNLLKKQHQTRLQIQTRQIMLRKTFQISSWHIVSRMTQARTTTIQQIAPLAVAYLKFISLFLNSN